MNPYVATTTGYRRKIGPKSKYGMNDDAPAYGVGIGPQGAQSAMNARSSFSGQTSVGMNARSSFSGQTSVGMPHTKTESRFQTSMREAREVSAANAKAEEIEKKRTAEAKQKETAAKAKREAEAKAKAPGAFMPFASMIQKARDAAKPKVPFRPQGGSKPRVPFRPMRS